MKKSLMVVLCALLLQNIACAKSEKKEIQHYNPSAFIGWDSKKSRVAIKDVTLEVKQWNKKEKRVALTVKSEKGTFQDDYLFCENKGVYFYCAVEDDGGYVKISPKRGIKVDVDFVNNNGEEPKMVFHIEQKNKKIWVPSLKMEVSKKKLFYK